MTAASGAERTFDSPRARPARQRLVDQRVGQAARRHALDAGARAAGARRGRPDGPARRRSTGAAVRPGGADERPIRERRVEDGGLVGRRAPASRGGRCWRARGRSAAAERAEDDDARRAPSAEWRPGPRARCPTRPCRAATVRAARRRPRARPVPSSPIESPSPTHRSIATPSAAAWRAPPSAAMTSLDRRRPSRARRDRVRSGAATSPSARMRATMARCYPSAGCGPDAAIAVPRRPDARLRPCPTPPPIPRSSASSMPPPARA